MDQNGIPDGPQQAASNAKESKREQSSIQFPYGDLEDAISIAKAIHEVGGQSCQLEQLAGFLKVSAASGSFRARLAYPRVFGLAEYERGEARLTELGLRIVDPSQTQNARVDAFLTVPLYKAIYEKYKGYTLPPPSALEKEMAALGVSSKQTDKARQAFDRSAKQAGFYWAGSDRLTLPVTKARPETKPIEAPVNHGASDQSDASNAGLHPFIQGLLKTLPAPDSDWSVSERAKWLQTAASIFGLIYHGDGEIIIKVKEEALDL